MFYLLLRLCCFSLHPAPAFGIIHQSNGGIMGAPSLQVEVTAVPSITTET